MHLSTIFSSYISCKFAPFLNQDGLQNRNKVTADVINALQSFVGAVFHNDKDLQQFLLPNGQPSWYYGVQRKQGKQPCSNNSIKLIMNLLHELYLGLHSNQITKRRKFLCIYKFHSFDNHHDFRIDATSKSSFHR